MVNGSTRRHWKLAPDALAGIAAHIRALADQQGLSAAIVPTADELQVLIEESSWATIIPDEGRYTFRTPRPEKGTDGPAPGASIPGST